MLGAHCGRLDEEHVSARPGHRQTCCHAGNRSPDRRLLEVLLATKPIANRVEVDCYRRGGLTRRDASRGLSKKRAQLSLELADAGLSGVLSRHRLKQLVGDRDLFGGQTVAFDLSRPQIAA